MEVITLNNEMFSQKCSELISKIDFQPDLVIGILNGGGYVANKFKILKKNKSVRFESIKLKRKSKLKNKKITEIVLRILPYKVLNWLRVLESNRTRKTINEQLFNELKEYEVDFEFEVSSKKAINNILIIDDAIDTGKTMFVVKNSLDKLFPESQIKTAIISWTLDNSIVKPDYWLYKNILIRFPWSKDYKGKDFEKKSFSC